MSSEENGTTADKLAFDIRERNGAHHVVLASIDGKRIFGVPVFSSSDHSEALVVMDAIRTGLLTKIEQAVKEEAK